VRASYESALLSDFKARYQAKAAAASKRLSLELLPSVESTNDWRTRPQKRRKIGIQGSGFTSHGFRRLKIGRNWPAVAHLERVAHWASSNV
jgi:hypothetical protein